MANNGKKEFPENGNEQDVVYARSIYCYIRNGRGITKNVKRSLNKRFRKFHKNNLKNI